MVQHGLMNGGSGTIAVPIQPNANMKKLFFLLFLLLPLAATAQIRLITTGTGTGSGSGAITNLTPIAGALYLTSGAVTNSTNFSRVFAMWTTGAQVGTNITAANDPGYIRTTNEGWHILSYTLSYRPNVAHNGYVTNAFFLSTNVGSVGTNIAGASQLSAVNRAVTNYITVSGTATLNLQSNTYVGLCFYTVGATGAATSTNDISFERAALTLVAVGGGTFGASSSGLAALPDYTITNRYSAQFTNLGATYLAGAASNKVLVTSDSGSVTQAFKHVMIETNLTPVAISNIVAGASFGDVIEFGAGTFNLGFQSIRLPVGVTIRGQGNGATKIYGFGNFLTNGCVFVIASSNVVEDIDFYRSTSTTIVGAAIGFSYTRADSSLVDSAATNFVIRRVRCLGWDTDSMYFAHTNYFSGRIENCEGYSGQDNLVVSGVGLHGGATNWVEVISSKFITEGYGSLSGGSDMNGIRVTVANVALHDSTFYALNGNNAYAIRGSGTNSSRIFVYGGDYKATGTNSVYVAGQVSTFDPTNVTFYTWGNPFVAEQCAPNTVVVPSHGSYSNLFVRGTVVTPLIQSTVRSNATVAPALNAGNEFLWGGITTSDYETNLTANLFVVPTNLVYGVTYKLTIASAGYVTTVSNSSSFMTRGNPASGFTFPGISTNGVTDLYIWKSFTGSAVVTNCLIVGPQYGLVGGQNITLTTNNLTLTITASVPPVVTNVANVKYAIQQPAITASNLVLNLDTNNFQCTGLTNIILTNWSALAYGVNGKVKVAIENTIGVSVPIVWPAFGSQHGLYKFHTNGLNDVLTATVAPPSTNTIASFEVDGTNIYGSVTYWKR